MGTTNPIQRVLSVCSILLGSCAPSALGARAGDAADHHDQETSTSALEISEDWGHEDGWVVSPPLDAPAGATRVTALLTTLVAAPIALEARGTIGGEPATDWIPLTAFLDDEETHVSFADLGIVADGAQLRAREDELEAVDDLRWSAIVPEVADEATPDVAGVRSEALIADLRGLGIVPREDWGARRTSCSPRETSRTRISIHHTEGGSVDPARQLRGIQSYHISKGWCDVGYHFLIGADGRIYEGRPVDIRGIHVRSNNTGNLGVSYIGCFDARECSTQTELTPELIDLGGRLVGTLSRLYRITPSSTTVRGHRDQVSTTCPGSALHARIPDIISIARTSTLSGETPPAPPPAPPPSAAVCRHSFGGSYASQACSASYQCCDGRWLTRATGCGACACVEETGVTGCSGSTSPSPMPPPAPSTRFAMHAGIELDGMRVPRAGLANETLRRALGVATEPYGTSSTYESLSFVRGRTSWFGGPRDTGVTTTETGAITGERLRSLNDPLSPSASQLAASPERYYYVAMRWDYAPRGVAWLRTARLLVVSPSTGRAIVVRPVDWGPNTSTRRIVDLSPQAMTALGIDTDAEVLISWAAPGTALGIVP